MDFQEEYDKGYEAYKSKSFGVAREIFNKLYNQTGSFKALRMLINIDISQSNLKSAREKIDNNMYYGNVNTLRLLERIEIKEYNYEKSLELANSVVNTFDYKISNFYNLAYIYIINGRFNEAREILRNIPFEDRNELSDFYYVLMDIVFQNYERALSRLEKINKLVLPKPFYVLYDKANAIINYNLGRKKDDFEVLSRKGDFFKHMLYDEEDICLQKFLKDHEGYINDLERFNILKFREDIDFLSLVEELKEKIKKVNPRYYNFMSIYGIIMDYPVGYNGERPINGVIVNTPIRVNRITKISLADFSDEFNAEGLSTDKSLRKRLNVK